MAAARWSLDASPNNRGCPARHVATRLLQDALAIPAPNGTQAVEIARLRKFHHLGEVPTSL
jgi:hypothetical protein